MTSFFYFIATSDFFFKLYSCNDSKSDKDNYITVNVLKQIVNWYSQSINVVLFEITVKTYPKMFYKEMRSKENQESQTCQFVVTFSTTLQNSSCCYFEGIFSLEDFKISVIIYFTFLRKHFHQTHHNFQLCLTRYNQIHIGPIISKTSP